MSTQNSEGRIVYADFCKLVAIFLVTWGHCSQALSGLSFPPIFGVPGLLIPVHMPLFMMMSGFFINPTKIRNASFGFFIWSKTQRLLVPSIVWYFLFCLVSFHLPTLWEGINYYWYLNSLFVCYIIIYITVKISGNHLIVGCLASILIVVFSPYSSYLKINFMYPFLWAGYFLRKFIESDRSRLPLELVLLTVSLYLYAFWDVQDSVYLTPFDTLFFSFDSLLVYLYRFSLGFICSTAIVLSIKRFIANKNILPSFALLGRDTLFVYVSSFIINAIVAHFFKHYNFYFSTVGVLDFISVLFTLLIILSCSFAAKLIRKNATARLLILGEQ